jgi:hypothetical protein
MYIKKLAFLQNKYPENMCIAGITTSVINSISVGTPCIALLPPFVMNDNENHNQSILYKDIAAEIAFDNLYKTGKKRTRDTSTSTAEDLYQIAKKDLIRANNILSKLTFKDNIEILFPFSASHDYEVNLAVPSWFYINGSLPIIFDNSKHMEINRLSDIYSTSDILDFYNILLECLRENRFVNYTFSGVAASNLKYMLEDINSIHNALAKKLPNRTCFFQYKEQRIRVLADTVSISFYRLKDVVPIFNTKKSDGICMEVFITNSDVDSNRIYSKANGATYRFIFSKFKENVFTVDGDSVNRPYDVPSAEAISIIGDLIFKEVPNDVVPRKINKRKKAEVEVCAV